MRRVTVRTEPPSPQPVAVDLGRGWLAVVEVAERWVVEVGWWRVPPQRWEQRCYWRLLLQDGSCVDLYQDSDGGAWQLARRWG